MTMFFGLTFEEIRKMHEELLLTKSVDLFDERLTITDSELDGCVDGTMHLIKEDGETQFTTEFFNISTETLLLMFISSCLGKSSVSFTLFKTIDEAEQLRIKEDLEFQDFCDRVEMEEVQTLP